MGAQCSVDDVYDVDFALQNPTSESAWSVHPAVRKDDLSKVTVFIRPRDKEKDKVAEREGFKYLRVLRHPCILKFYESYEMSKEICIVTEPVRPLELLVENLHLVEMIAGLHSIIQALSFLHDKGGLSHNNISMSSVFVSELTGLWKLGGMESVCKFEDVKSEKLRGKELVDFGHVHDAYSFGVLFCEVFESRSDLAGSSISKLVNKIQEQYLNVDPKARPKLKALLDEDFFRHPYLDILQFLQNITVKTSAERGKFFSSLAYNLFSVPSEIIAKRLAPQLMNRMALADDSLVQDFLPHLLTPCLEQNPAEFKPGKINPLVPEDLFKEYIVPILMKLFALRTRHVRMMLLQHLHCYVRMFDKDVLKDFILPKILLGLHDTNDGLVSATFQALSCLVKVLGSKIVVGGDRFKYFPERRPKISGSTSSTPPSPQARDQGNGVQRKLSSVSEALSTPLVKEQSLKINSEVKNDLNQQRKYEERQKRQEEMRKRNEERRKERLRKKAEKAGEKSLASRPNSAVESLERGSECSSVSSGMTGMDQMDENPSLQTVSEPTSEATEDLNERADLDAWDCFETNLEVDESREPNMLDYSSPVSEQTSRKNSNSWDEDFGGVDFGQIQGDVGPWSESQSQGSSPRTSHSCSDVEISPQQASRPTLLEQAKLVSYQTYISKNKEDKGNTGGGHFSKKKIQGSKVLKLGKGAMTVKDRTSVGNLDQALGDIKGPSPIMTSSKEPSPSHNVVSSHNKNMKNSKITAVKKKPINDSMGAEFDVKAIDVGISEPDFFADMAPSIDFTMHRNKDTRKVSKSNTKGTISRKPNRGSGNFTDTSSSSISSKLAVDETHDEVESGWDDGDWGHFE